MAKFVIHRDGSHEPFQTEKIIRAIQDIVHDLQLDDPFVAVFKVIKNVELKIPEQVKTEELDEIVLKAIEQLITEDPMYDKIATRQLVKMINKTVSGRFNSFAEYIQYGVSEKLLSEKLLDFDLGTLELSLNHNLDDEFNYFGLATIKDRYLIRDRKKQIIEQPQWMWMRVAMGLSISEKNKEEFAVKVYNKMSALKYLHSTPTLYNSGTPFSQLSSCYISVIGDSMDSIMDKAKEAAMFAKYAGGIGSSVTKLRAGGSHIKSINAKSSGPIPFIKIFDTVVNGIMQGGRRRSSQVIYMEPWHYNIHDFLDLKETNGSEYVRTRSLNTALWIPDEFMERVVKNEDWYLFDPAECPKLTSTRGKEFSLAYAEYIEMAKEGKLALFKKLPAQELYRDCLMRLAKTGNYRFNFKDRHNESNQAMSYSMIHSSNLCTEISIANSENSTAVCTLASLNLPRFVNAQKLKKENIETLSLEEKLSLINREEMKETIEIGIQALDNVVDVNFYPSQEAQKNSLDLRPLGLGFMGLAELFIDLGISYDSSEALKLSDHIGAFIYKHALEKSIELGKIRGAFADYDASRYPYEARRNALLLAVAPTASISLIAGTSSTVDSYFANVYSRETLGGKFTIIIKQLVEKIKEKGLRNDDMRSKIINAGGSIQHIKELDGVVNKSIFKTAYEYSPSCQIDIAATLQKHVDQAISRNMYLKEESRSTMFDVYVYARKAGLKGTYYCFIEKTIQGEKYTESVNKRGERAGFGSTTTASVSTSSAQPAARGFGAAASSISASQPSDEITVIKKIAAEQEANDLSSIDFKNVTDEQKKLIEQKLISEKGADYVEKLKSGQLYGDACPTNPFEKVMCESCQ
ncbi:MAG TPA: ribonucleoside-diphosphate reductase subunit alpha [Candidatus Absconditabacterales bacterium]|nr:ribonucleoside-diphosphate reductase subunit alpha [Candidatus Absconditabacterales bacterium]